MYVHACVFLCSSLGHGICGGPRTTLRSLLTRLSRDPSLVCCCTCCGSRSRGALRLQPCTAASGYMQTRVLMLCGENTPPTGPSSPPWGWCVMFAVTVSEFALTTSTHSSEMRKEPWTNQPSFTGVKPWLCSLQHDGIPTFTRIRRDLLPQERGTELLFSLSLGSETTFLWDGLIGRFSLCDGLHLLNSLFHL